MILFQLLWLFIAVAVEAFVFHQRLKFSRKKSLEYALSINLFSNIFGWFIFFYLQDKISENLQIGVISYIITGEFYGFQTEINNFTLLISLGLMLLISNSLLEIQFFNLLTLILEGFQGSNLIYSSRQKSPQLTRRFQNIERQPSLPSVIFIGNIISYIIIFLILVVRSIPSFFF